MWKSTFAFSLDRDGNQALIVMDCGEGVMRCRTMSIETLAEIVRACEHVQQHIVGVLAAEEGFGKDVPQFPKCIPVAGGKNIAGVCNVSVVASKCHGRILFSTAFYDLQGGDAPALLLTGDQLDRFIGQAKGLLNE
jgi:hypothetical protein